MKAIFLDRDDTIIVNKDYLNTPDGIEFLPNAIAGLQAFRDLGYQLIVLTNQSGIARGYFSPQTLQAIHERLRVLLAHHGLRLAGIYVCPHAPTDDCDCRKPRTGLLQQALRDFDIDLTRTAMLGDGKGDIGLANAAHLPAIHSTNGKTAPLPNADFVCRDLLEAAHLPLFNP